VFNEIFSKDKKNQKCKQSGVVATSIILSFRGRDRNITSVMPALLHSETLSQKKKQKTTTKKKNLFCFFQKVSWWGKQEGQIQIVLATLSHSLQ
jgi:hypothetical protein